MNATFQVYGVPAAQGSKRYLGRGIMVESSKRVAPWRADVANAAQQAQPEGWDPTRPMAVNFEFRFKRPKAHYRANGELKPNAPEHHTTVSGDIDKLMRSTCDAITASGLWLDDSQVVHVVASRVFASDGKPPGLSAVITAIPPR